MLDGGGIDLPDEGIGIGPRRMRCAGGIFSKLWYCQKNIRERDAATAVGAVRPAAKPYRACYGSAHTQENGAPPHRTILPRHQDRGTRCRRRRVMRALLLQRRGGSAAGPPPAPDGRIFRCREEH